MALRPQITHIGLHTADIAAMERFYTGVIGLVVTDRGKVARLGNADIVFLSANPANHHQVVLISWQEPKRPSVVNQMSFKVDTLADLKEMRARINLAAVGPITPIDHGNAWSIYTSDPDGNGVEIYLDSPWQVAQPHGLPLDLDRSVEDIMRATEARIRSDPSFEPRERWQEAFARRLSP